jgi:hypothetical protein
MPSSAQQSQYRPFNDAAYSGEVVYMAGTPAQGGGMIPMVTILDPNVPWEDGTTRVLVRYMDTGEEVYEPDLIGIRAIGWVPK